MVYVAVAVVPIALDEDAEHIENRITVAVEGRSRELHARRLRPPFPQLAQLGKRDFAVSVYRLNQPYILFKQSRYRHVY